ncbi:helix-turn-helix domain-containing protein [Jeotgalibacillus sp. R-1-5s-1]|uniref:helix-turn-helix domain-containing protein n=1 Tax=Jeotgalibacillus sp. R-1-5s-1 TaxID=2555897 RepID=UPI00106C8CD4|nr:helix-turn-helix domain-containing protein [Jeotgalibacillus sp. R-1-5s-1]TFE00017.1 helix-turn-helix domain-containing protein [Jeotgalibacillus sp. R-1-5s-1]
MIGDKIKHLRTKKGYSVSGLAFKSNVSKSYLSNLENNKKSNPSLDILSKIANTLDVSVDYLVDDQSDTKEKCLDQEWVNLIKESIKEGMSKRDFSEFQVYLKFRKNLLEQNKNMISK